MSEFEARRWARQREAGVGRHVVIDGAGVAVAAAFFSELLIRFKSGAPMRLSRLLTECLVGILVGGFLGWRSWERNESRYADYVVANAACTSCAARLPAHADWCPIVTGRSIESESLWISIRRRLW